jgi:hypothetical protein
MPQRRSSATAGVLCQVIGIESGKSERVGDDRFRVQQLLQPCQNLDSAAADPARRIELGMHHRSPRALAFRGQGKGHAGNLPRSFLATPEGAKGHHHPVRRRDLQNFAVEHRLGVGLDIGIARSRLEVRLDPRAVVVTLRQFGIGRRCPDSLRGGADDDLVNMNRLVLDRSHLCSTLVIGARRSEVTHESPFNRRERAETGYAGCTVSSNILNSSVSTMRNISKLNCPALADPSVRRTPSPSRSPYPPRTSEPT